VIWGYCKVLLILPIKMSANWSKFDIEKFDGTTSFALWQIRMKAILSNLGVKAALTGRPKDLEGDVNDKKWEEMDDKALSTIQLCVSDSTLQEILTETKAADAWAKLEQTYMQKTVTNRLRLKQRFHSLKMAELKVLLLRPTFLIIPLF
jgi:hypothetical protein